MKIKLMACAKLPTRFGEFTVYAFRDMVGKEHLAVTHGTFNGTRGKGKPSQPVNVRVHSKCLTGDTFTSLRCDCRDQLEMALDYLARHGGILVYLDQEGRGIGLANKIKAYALQDQGHDTVEANRKLGFKDDPRNYRIAACILQLLGVRTLRLLTNNPQKIRGLEENGLTVVERIPLVPMPTAYNRRYIETKRKKMHHLL